MLNFVLFAGLMVTVLSVVLVSAKIESALSEYERKQNRDRTFQARKSIYSKGN